MGKLSDQDKVTIITAYQQGREKLDLARQYGMTQQGIHSLLKRRGVEMRLHKSQRQYHVQDDYFDTIDTEPKAYWLGLMYADGCVRVVPGKRPTHQRYSCHLSLQERDIDVVHALARTLYPSGRPIGHDRGSYRLVIYSKRICEALIRLGCVPRKSLILTFPTANQVPPHLLRHFIRGYFDGDGSVGTYRRNGPKSNKTRKTATVCSSPSFIRALREMLKPIVGCTGAYYEPKLGDGRYATLTYGGRLAVEALRDYMYQDVTVCMKRKREKFYT